MGEAKQIARELFSMVKTLLIIFGMTVVVQRHVLTPIKVEGTSMYPTLHDGDAAILWSLTYEPQLFDVVVFTRPTGQHYVKRIVGIPGQHIEFYNNQLFIDNEKIKEPYLNEEGEIIDFILEDICQFRQCDVIPEGYYFVLGDNRSNSTDSRHIGLIHREQILGKVAWIQWPLLRFGSLP